jgi:DNA-binding NarL/FixJ family response regulator
MGRVFIVAANRIYREALVELLGRSGFAVATALAVVEEAATRVDPFSVDVGIVDLGCSGSVHAVAALAASLPHTTLVAAGVRPEIATLNALAEGGITYYALLDSSRGELITTVRAAAASGPQTRPRSLERPAPQPDVSAHAVEGEPKTLTPRERQIVEMIEQGQTDKEIARQLGVELRTVKNHVHNLLRKLQLRRRGEAAAWLRRAR